MIDQVAHDGFEGVGLFVEVFVVVAAIAVLLPIGTALRKLVVDAHSGSVPRGSLVWLTVLAGRLAICSRLKYPLA